MTQEQQVTSLELSKRLKELGVKQESLFYWVISRTTNYHISYCENDKSLLPTERNDYYSAFTVAELGKMLPLQTLGGSYLSIYKLETNEWEISYSPTGERPIALKTDKTEANARANMLIYLLENGLIKV